MDYKLGDKVVLFYSQTDNETYALKVKSITDLSIGDKVSIIDDYAIPINLNFSTYNFYSIPKPVGRLKQIKDSRYGRNILLGETLDNTYTSRVINCPFRFKKPSILYIVLNRYTHHYNWNATCYTTKTVNGMPKVGGGYYPPKTIKVLVTSEQATLTKTNYLISDMISFSNSLYVESLKGMVCHISISDSFKRYGILTNSISFQKWSSLYSTTPDFFDDDINYLNILDYNSSFDLESIKMIFDSTLSEYRSRPIGSISDPDYIVLLNYNIDSQHSELAPIISGLSSHISNQTNANLLVFDYCYNDIVIGCTPYSPGIVSYAHTPYFPSSEKIVNWANALYYHFTKVI